MRVPIQIGPVTVLQYHQKGVGYRILGHLPDNRTTPFVIATWYPHKGNSDWYRGTYFNNARVAARKFGEGSRALNEKRE